MIALAVSASGAAVAVATVSSALAAVDGTSPATSLQEREAARASAKEEREEERLDNREERAAIVELRLACNAKVYKGREAFNERQERRSAHFHAVQDAIRVKFRLIHASRKRREGFMLRMGKRWELFKALQAKRRDAFDLRSDKASESCAAITTTEAGASTIGAASIYAGTINEADEFGGEEILLEAA